MTRHQDEQKDVTWQDVRTAEEGLLKHSGSTIGLALSGGGIRSATFSLGFLQYLAKRKWLREIDYLSTVSGGGYIGALFSALTARTRDKHKANGKKQGTEAEEGESGGAQQQQNSEQQGEGNREKDNGSGAQGNTEEKESETEKQVAPETWDEIEKDVNDPQFSAVQWIRSHSNYLTPRTGLSGDTVATIGLILTNLLLSTAIVGAIVGAIALLFLLLGQLLIGTTESIRETAQTLRPFSYRIFVLLVFIFSFFASAWMVYVASKLSKRRSDLLKQVQDGQSSTEQLAKGQDENRIISSFVSVIVALLGAVATLYIPACYSLTFLGVTCLRGDLLSTLSMTFAVLAFVVSFLYWKMGSALNGTDLRGSSEAGYGQGFDAKREIEGRPPRVIGWRLRHHSNHPRSQPSHAC